MVKSKPFTFGYFLAQSILVASMLLAEATPLASSDTETVGPSGSGRAVTPVNQIVTPLGLQVELPGLRPQALALSPNGKILATSGKTSELIVVDPETGKILQRVPLPSENANEPQPETVSPQILQPDKEGLLSFTGLIFSPDGTRIYLSNVNGSIKVFSVGADNRVTGLYSIALPKADAPPAQRGNTVGLGDFTGRKAPLRGPESLQSPRRNRFNHRQGAEAV